MSQAGIKAGRAYIEIAAENRTEEGFSKAEARVVSFAATLSVFRTMADWGTQAVRAVLDVASGFADQGSKVHDLSIATGASSEELSALGYAAQQSGASLDSIGTAMKGLAKFAGDVAENSNSAQTMLRQLGISGQEFLRSTPTERLAMVADGLAGIADPGLRAEAAMKALGKSAMELLPMLDGGSAELNKMVARAKELNLVVSTEDAAAADALGDAYDDLKLVLGSIAFKIGRAAAETLTTLLGVVTPIAVGVGRFVEHNQALVVTLAAVVAIAATVGTAVVGIGGSLAIVTLSLGAIAGVLPVIVGGLAAIFSPLGLVVVAALGLAAALTYGARMFATTTTAGQAMTAALLAGFRGLHAAASETFRGIGEAIMGGRWDLAARIAMAGLQVSYNEGLAMLESSFHQFALSIENAMVGALNSIGNYVKQAVAAWVASLGLVAKMLGADDLGSQIFQTGIQIGATDMTVGSSAGGGLIASVLGSRAEAARRAADEAKRALADALAEADRLRKERDAAVSSKPRGGMDGAADYSSSSSALGTFSGSIAGLLGRAGASTAERTAKATEAMADDIAAVRGALETGGVRVLA
jgi:hypothetical protein